MKKIENFNFKKNGLGWWKVMNESAIKQQSQKTNAFWLFAPPLGLEPRTL
ncbi:hypothetical protein [Brumimicrobium aurantiacum]|nr:hypothetical protein [Brumimicrobium aurantiacum]